MRRARSNYCIKVPLCNAFTEEPLRSGRRSGDSRSSWLIDLCCSFFEQRQFLNGRSYGHGGATCHLQKQAEAQRAQAELIRKQREVEEQKREIELTGAGSAAIGQQLNA